MKSKRKPSSAFLAKRKELIALSKAVKLLVKEGQFDSVNEGLLEIYSDGEETEFNTFHQWKEKGYSIMKGSKAFLVWGKPRQVAVAEPQTPEEEEYKYWPVCYLFSENQVERKAEHETA